MNLFENCFFIQRIDQLFRLKATGSPLQFGKKLGLSERQVRRVIEEFKDIGIPVEYCKKRKTYFYKENVVVKFEISVIKDDEKKKIMGGEIKNITFFENISQTDILCPFAPSPLYQVDKQRR